MAIPDFELVALSGTRAGQGHEQAGQCPRCPGQPMALWRPGKPRNIGVKRLVSPFGGMANCAAEWLPLLIGVNRKTGRRRSG